MEEKKIKSIICESEFNTEDKDHPFYSLCEYDLYQWIPKESQNKHRIANHRLKIWRNFKTGEFELVMDLMEDFRKTKYFKNKSNIHTVSVHSNNYNGKSIIVKKGTLSEVLELANTMYKDFWSSVKFGNVLREMTMGMYNKHNIPKQKYNEKAKNQFIECNHTSFPYCRFKEYGDLKKQFETNLNKEKITKQLECKHNYFYYKTNDITDDSEKIVAKLIFFICKNCLQLMSKKYNLEV